MANFKRLWSRPPCSIWTATDMTNHVRADGRVRGPGLRPRLISIADAYRYAGVGRSKFYADILPKLKTVRIGRRNLIDLASLDDLIDELAAE